QGGATSPPENGNMVFLSNLDSPLFPLLGVNELISMGPASPGVAAYEVREEGRTLTQNLQSVPRTFVVHHWQTASSANALAALLRLSTSGTPRPGPQGLHYDSSVLALREAAIIET